MKAASNVRATAHLLGRRIDLRWKNPAASEFPASVPFVGVRVLRKERTFPETATDGDLVFSGLVADGTLRAEVSDRGLSPLTTYYYTVFTLDSSGAVHADDGCRVSAFATESYDLAERYYRLLPAIHQRLDRPLRKDEIASLPAFVRAALEALPPALQNKGQLRRLFHALFAPHDLSRSFAEGLPHVQDPALARPEFLLPLARSLGWELDRTLPVYRKRNEIRDAPRQYRGVGTIPNLRGIVTRYARWYAQVAEIDERIVRSNAAPMLNVYSVALDNGVWRGADDAAPFLGFGAGNDQATGTGGPPETPARLTGNVLGPFHLRPGMELALSTDGRPPSRVRFHQGDFKDIAQATGAEVVAVLSRLLPEIRCELALGRIALASHTLGDKSTLEVQSLASSAVTLEGAPRGRLATFTDAQGRQRLFYQVNDPLARTEKWEAAASVARRPEEGGAPVSSAIAPTSPSDTVRFKVFRGGEWGPSIAFPTAGAPAGDPAATRLPNGDLFVAWVENPGTGLSRIRFRTGTPRSPTSAVLRGRRSGPFPVTPGMRLLFNRADAAPLGFEFVPQDFANPAQPTSLEVRAALAARLSSLVVTLALDGTLVLRTAAVGGSARLDLDLAASSAAEALGFEDENSAAAGEWGDDVDWQAPTDDLSLSVALPGSTTTPRIYADLHAITDTNGNVRLFWARHEAGRWAVRTARRVGGVWTGATTLSSAGGGCREPFAVMDASGRVFAFWSRCEVPGAIDDRWTLRFRRLLFAGTDVWLAESVNPVFPAAAADRQPALLRVNNLFQLFFQSTRTGSVDVWSATFNPATQTATAPNVMLIGPQADHVPTPLVLPDQRIGMLFRSDRGFDLARAATRYFPVSEGRVTFPAETPTLPFRPPSFRTEDSGTLRRFAGSVTPVHADESRRDRMRQWDDLTAYTPQGVNGETLSDNDLYTMGTVGLFLSPLISVDPLTPAMIERLREVLHRFLPIHVRAVVILAPRVDIEYVYSPTDIFEKYDDDHPDIDYYAGVQDSAAAELPGWSFLLSNTPGHISWDPGNPSSLLHRVFYEPPQ